MKDFQFIFIRLSGYLILGILFAFYFEIKLDIAMALFALAIILFLLSFWRARKLVFRDTVFGISTFFLIFSAGAIIAVLHEPSSQKQHYLNVSSEIKQHTATLKITEELKPTTFSERFIAETESLEKDGQSIRMKGKLLLNIQKDSNNNSKIKPGTRLIVPWNPEEIKPALNPFQFDYKKYMRQLKVERQMNLSKAEIGILSNSKGDLKVKASNLREEIIKKLKAHQFGEDEIAVYQALILGQRREINNKLYKDYAAAGAIHILAISGLHIGILLYLLNFLMLYLNRFRHGRLIRTILLILLLWSFALITGLSPSVVRAVTMFSFIAIGLQLRRKTSVLNSLFVSLFFLLIIDPYYLFQVGFQLSYLAVFSIIIFQPLLYGLLKTENKILDYFWKLASVSLAAQIGVIPVSIYYFHQFPGLFLMTNLIILPFLGILLGLGILIILLAFVNLLPEFLVKAFDLLLNSMNTFIEWIASKESMIISNIDFSSYQLAAVYFFIVALIFILRKKTFLNLSFLLISILIFQIASIFNYSEIPYSETVIFHRTKSSLIATKNADVLHILSSDQELKLAFIEDYSRERKIDHMRIEPLPNAQYLSGQLSLIIDTAANYNIPDFHPDLLILRNSPKVNLERIIEELKPKKIIADGSNFHSYVHRWKATATNKKIPFHHTGEKGAYLITSNEN